MNDLVVFLMALFGALSGTLIYRSMVNKREEPVESKDYAEGIQFGLELSDSSVMKALETVKSVSVPVVDYIVLVRAQEELEELKEKLKNTLEEN